MKIVIVIDSWNRGNGCIVAAHALVNQLQKRGHEISLVTTAGKAADKFSGDVHEVSGFYLPGVKESMKNMGFLFGRGKKKVYQKAFEDADIVHIMFPYFMSRNAVKVANKMNKPVMGACHIQAQNMTGAMGKDSKILDTFFNAWFNWELFGKVPAVHCPSDLAADLIKTHGSNAHFRVISNGIPEVFIPMDDPERPDFFEDYFVIMNVGRNAREKRQETIIEGVMKSKYKDKIKLLICGKGENHEMLIEKGKELPVEPLIRYITEEEKHLYLNTADLYLHTSRIELESLTCLEAVGCGLPGLIVDSPSSAASQFALDERFLYVDEIEGDMASKIDYWYENKGELANLKKSVLELAKKYRIKHSIDAMEDLYNDVIKSNISLNGLLPKGEKIYQESITK